jgi:hypothetical protein
LSKFTTIRFNCLGNIFINVKGKSQPRRIGFFYLYSMMLFSESLYDLKITDVIFQGNDIFR